MKLINGTTLDNAWLLDMLRAVTPAGTGDFDVAFNAGENSGRAYCRAGRIIVNLNASTRFPYIEANHDAYLGIECRSMEELAISLCAHEARHIWQYRNTGVVSEFDADAYSLRVLRAYRAGELNIGPDAKPFEDTPDPEADALGDLFAHEVSKALGLAPEGLH